MSTTRFSPESWLRAAQAIDEEAATFQSRARVRLGSLAPDDLGPRGTLVDKAFAAVFPQRIADLRDEADRVVRGLQGDAATMVTTAHRYTQAEDAAVDLVRELRREV